MHTFANRTRPKIYKLKWINKLILQNRGVSTAAHRISVIIFVFAVVAKYLQN